MTTLNCPCPDCGEAVTNADKDVAIALFNAHVSTHTVNTGRIHSNSSSKSEKLSRPKVTQGMLEEAWNSFTVLWNLYKNGAGLSQAELGLQLIYCCDEDLMEQLLRADPSIVSKSEKEQMESIRSLAVVPVAMGVRRSEMLNMSQDVGELSRAFLAKIQGKAATCEFKTNCKEACCQGKAISVDFTSTIVKYVLVNGLVDAEIRREVLGWKSLDESSLADTVAFIEQKEMARDAFKGEAAGVKTGYKKQQASVSPSDKFKLRKRVKCEDCDSQINQFARARSGKLCEHKFCKPCWQKKNKQKEMESSKGGTKVVENDVTADEASTLFVSCNNVRKPIKSRSKRGSFNKTSVAVAGGEQLNSVAIPIKENQLSVAIQNNRNYMEELPQVERENQSRHDNIDIVKIAYIKNEAAIVLDHHIFDSKAGWVKRNAWKQPTLRLISRPCNEMYSKLGHKVPTAESTVVDGVADTGAQVCLWSLSDYYKAGYKKKELIKVKQKIAAANRQPIEILGAVFLSVEANSFRTNLMAFVTPDINGLYLSRQVLTELYVIPKSFPTAGDAKCSMKDQERATEVSAVVNHPSCGCLPRKPPPERPATIPIPCNIENIPKMKKWLLDTFASSTFNRCPHQPLPFIKANPITLHVDKNATPTAHHTPCVLPIHWRDKIKEGLDNDEKLGVIEKVPDGVPTTWLHRMVVVAKPNGEPRRTVDLSPLNKFCKRETHVTVPPFRQARLVPAQTWKTVTDAWSGYHSALIREEDRHYTTFITDWGRYRYRVAPQGYVSSNDGYCKRYDKIIEPVERKAKVTDDTIMWDSDQELENHWWRVFDYLTLVGKNGIVLNGDKFQFCEKVVDFAGFRISEQKVEPLPKYLKAIESFPTPKNISDVRSWFGLINQVAHYAQLRDMVAPLKPLLSPKSKFFWTNELDESFRNSRQAIVEAIKNGVEIFEPERPTKLHTDWSKKGLGFYLAQKHCSCPEEDPSCCENGWRITLSGSRFLKQSETNYVPIEGESLGLAWALDTDRFAVALMTKRNTPDYDSKLSSAEIVMGKRLRDALPMIPKNLMVMNNLTVHPVWRDLWSKKESVIQDRYIKSIEDPPTKGSRLQPLKENYKVR